MVECEVTHELTVDEHVRVGGVEEHLGGFAGELDAEADGPAAEFGSADFGHGDVDLVRSVFERLTIGRESGAGGEAFPRSDPADCPMRPLVVVVMAEPVELQLEFFEGRGERLMHEPFLQRLLEPFDFSAGLGVIRPRGDRAHASFAETGLELDFVAAEAS